jgi:uncharacterized protein YndB with AHSA1/START domain
MSPFAEADASVDARLGGAFTILMRGQGQRSGLPGPAWKFDPPHRLVFTWRSPYTGPEPSVVSISFVADGEGTQMTAVHDRLPAAQVESHGGGWGQILDNLVRVLGEEVAWTSP